ncbi:MAG: glycosyltransferase family A protein, partial [Acidobacteriota bacterium]
MRISLIVPIGGAAPAWPRCALSLERLDPPPAELILVLDGRDLNVSVPGATVLRLDQQGGPARARNAGAKVATGDVLLFIDSDIEVPPDTIARIAAYL